ncbi:Hypothetical protein R9X50_00578800 [Acrodontium crateriforme]|uniref:Superoxide dismutase 1 copper chaperone n=1 Tax=Acrodontium crateriforme TaxID=150365 RepID=A0AAQ3M9Z9_9PEZI|nr:Hypothetical protein R9X50_00578800 [Acrodontium crateriforme]
MTIPPFETTFAVPLNCEACVKDVQGSLYKLPGISNVTADLKSQLLSITGTAAPSAIVSAIQDTGRDAILRGSGSADGAAAVCILETHASALKANSVRGLIRMVQVAPAMTILDMTFKGVKEGTYNVTVRETGDISRGASSAGSVWDLLTAQQSSPPRPAKGIFGVIEVGKSGMGSVFLDKPIEVWELIGRCIVVSREKVEGPFEREDEDTFVGVIARSAGVWDNDKTVCSCSGKTVWEERTEQTSKGML